MRIPLADRFWPKVNKSQQGCWEWTASKFSNGYGFIASDTSPRRSLLAHRVSYELHYGVRPSGVVMHMCNNKKCVRPDHLKDSTTTENNRHAFESGLHNRKGSRNPNSRLTENAVRKLRAEYALGGITQRELSLKYLVAVNTVRRALSGSAWNHVV